MTSERQLCLGEKYTLRLNDLGLVVPTIVVTANLDTRMRRHQRSLELNDAATTDGLIEIETERPLMVVLDSSPKGLPNNDPSLTVEWPKGDDGWPKASIIIDPELTAKRETETFHDLNRAFWLGVIASQSIVEGTADQLTKSQRRTREIKLNLGQIGVSVIGNLTVAGAVEAATKVTTSQDIEAGLAAQALITGLYYYRNWLSLRKRPDQDLKKALAGRADDLASDFPALRRDYLIEDDLAL